MNRNGMPINRANIPAAEPVAASATSMPIQIFEGFDGLVSVFRDEHVSIFIIAYRANAQCIFPVVKVNEI